MRFSNYMTFINKVKTAELILSYMSIEVPEWFTIPSEWFEIKNDDDLSDFEKCFMIKDRRSSVKSVVYTLGLLDSNDSTAISRRARGIAELKATKALFSDVSKLIMANKSYHLKWLEYSNNFNADISKNLIAISYLYNNAIRTITDKDRDNSRCVLESKLNINLEVPSDMDISIAQVEIYNAMLLYENAPTLSKYRNIIVSLDGFDSAHLLRLRNEVKFYKDKLSNL